MNVKFGLLTAALLISSTGAADPPEQNLQSMRQYDRTLQRAQAGTTDALEIERLQKLRDDLTSGYHKERVRAARERHNIILDTDMGSDCDDAGALAVLHKLADEGEVNILGIVFSSGKNRYGVGVCDAINTYYGRGDLPLGQYRKDDVGDPRDWYCRHIATTTETFKHDVVDTAPDLVEVYRSLLQSAPDGTVTILTVGHPHGLWYLLQDDVTSALIPRKVKQWVAMAGAPDTLQPDWNFGRPGLEPYMGDLLRRWPTPLFISPEGEAILTGHGKLPSTPEENPVREAYRLYDPESYPLREGERLEHRALRKGRSSWDQVAVLYAVRPEMFRAERGTLDIAPDLKTQWRQESTEPRRYRVVPIPSRSEMERIIEGLMSAPPEGSR